MIPVEEEGGDDGGDVNDDDDDDDDDDENLHSRYLASGEHLVTLFVIQRNLICSSSDNLIRFDQ